MTRPRPEGELLVTDALDDTYVSDGSNHPAGYEHGVFVLDGDVYDTSQLPHTAYFTYNVASTSIVSTNRDLLDVLDELVTGGFFATGHTASPGTFLASRREEDDAVIGLGVPFNGFCPCQAVGDDVEVASVGRAPGPSGQAAHAALPRRDLGRPVLQQRRGIRPRSEPCRSNRHP